MMESVSGVVLVAFTSFFTLINPLGTMPVFMTMTSNLGPAEKRQTAIKAVVTAFGALLFFAFTGQLLFNFFGISVHGFRIVGGIIFFRMGFDMLEARLSTVKVKPEEARSYVSDISITPLGIPMLCGPGSITNIIVMMEDAQGWLQKSALLLVVAVVLTITLLVLISSSRISKLLGDTGNKVLMRIMGLIVMVIAVEFFLSGLSPVLTEIIRAATQ